MNYEGLVPVLIGLYATLLGFGALSPSADPQRNQRWRERYGTMMKICGPVCIAFGSAMLFRPPG